MWYVTGTWDRNNVMWRNLTRSLRGHGKQGSHAQRGPRRYRVDVHPERHPRNDHDQHGRQVALHQMESDGSSQVVLGLQAAVITWGIRASITVRSPLFAGMWNCAAWFVAWFVAYYCKRRTKNHHDVSFSRIFIFISFCILNPWIWLLYFIFTIYPYIPLFSLSPYSLHIFLCYIILYCAFKEQSTWSALWWVELWLHCGSCGRIP